MSKPGTTEALKDRSPSIAWWVNRVSRNEFMGNFPRDNISPSVWSFLTLEDGPWNVGKCRKCRQATMAANKEWTVFSFSSPSWGLWDLLPNGSLNGGNKWGWSDHHLHPMGWSSKHSLKQNSKSRSTMDGWLQMKVSFPQLTLLQKVNFGVVQKKKALCKTHVSHENGWFGDDPIWEGLFSGVFDVSFREP